MSNDLILSLRSAAEHARWEATTPGLYSQLLEEAANALSARPEERTVEALKQIANWPDEDDEWDAVNKYKKVRNIAKEALGNG